MSNNLKIIEERKSDGKYNFYLSKINNKLGWPANSMLVCFVCEQKNFNLQKALKSYKILSEGSNDVKIVSINEPACDIYDSKRKMK